VNKPTPFQPDVRPLTGSSESALGRNTRKLAFAALGLAALNSLACSDDDDTCPKVTPDAEPAVKVTPDAEPAVVGYGCVSVLGQDDEELDDCTFAYKLPKEGKELESCLPGQLFLYGPPKDYAVEAECGKLHGTVHASMDEGENDLQKTKLAGSLCYNDEQNIEADPLHTKVRLGNLIGRNSETRCEAWLTDTEQRQVDIVARKLDCSNVEGDCDPFDGQDLLTPQGHNGEYSEGHPIHLNVIADTHRIPAGEKSTVVVTLRERLEHEQEIDLPVIIEGPKAPEALPDAGTEGDMDAGADSADAATDGK